MGIMDRDYYREGTDAQAVAPKHKRSNRAGSPSKSVQPPPPLILPPAQYRPYSPPPLPRNEWSPSGFYPATAPVLRKGIPGPAWVAITGLALVIMGLAAILIVLAARNGNLATTNVVQAASVVPTLAPLPNVTERVVPTALPTVISTAVVKQPAQALPTLAQVASQSNFISGKVGQALQGPGYRLTVNSVERAASYGQLTKAKSGNILVAVDVTIESQQNTGVDVNSLYAKLIDGQGYAYTFTFTGKEPTLTSQNDLAAGQKLRGWVTFEVPAGATDLKFQYSLLSVTSNVVLSVALN